MSVLRAYERNSKPFYPCVRERFILALSALNGRKPTSHRLVLDDIFWIVHWIALALPALGIQ